MLLQGSAALMIRAGLRAAYGYLIVYSGLLVFGLMCLVWSGTAGRISLLLSEGRGGVLGPRVTPHAFRSHLPPSAPPRAFLFSFRAPAALREAPPPVISPHHPP